MSLQNILFYKYDYHELFWGCLADAYKHGEKQTPISSFRPIQSQFCSVLNSIFFSGYS